MQLSIYYAKGTTLAATPHRNTASSIHPYTISTTSSQQLSCAQEIQRTTTQSSVPFKTAVPLPPVLTTANPSSTSFTKTDRSPLPYKTADRSSPSASVQQALAQASQSLQTQLGDKSNSATSQLHPHSRPSSTSTPVIIISTMVQQRQQQQQESANQCLLASFRRYQSFNSKVPTTYQYNPLIAESKIQLLDRKKPYKIGDTNKVGGRILQSDRTSIKYWLEDDLNITETASGGHILNMAGYSYLAKNSEKNFTTCECEHRRNHQCSSIVV
jgi:hypothetical protein